MVFNATLINISVLSWRSILLVEVTGGPGENPRPVPSHWQNLSHNVVHLAMIEIRTCRRLWSRPECVYILYNNVCLRNNSVLVALFLVYTFPLMSHLYPPTSNGNFCQCSWKFVYSSNDRHPTCCLYFSLYIQNCKSIFSLTVGTFMSKSADSIWYDGYDLNH